jgi:hypothetical protein
MSEFGGQWYDFEISLEINPTRSGLLSKISALKSEKPDFAFVVYSGHGAFSRGTVLEINKDGDYVFESELREIAPRQVLIFDCCRVVLNLQLSEVKSYCRMLLINESHRDLRKYYEKRIMESIEQQASLYACSIGESSYDTNDGGVYSICFLSSIKPEPNDQFKLLALAQEEAKPKTKKMAYDLYSKAQTPDQTLPKCFSSQQLIISINPNYRF